MPKTLNSETCPKPARWFESGGRCGWAQVCVDCDDNPKARRTDDLAPKTRTTS